MRLVSSIENRNKQAETDQIRVKAALKVMESNYVGDIEKCGTTFDDKAIEDYCVFSFHEFDDVENCKDKD